jgi:hypothetical protein
LRLRDHVLPIIPNRLCLTYRFQKGGWEFASGIKLAEDPILRASYIIALSFGQRYGTSSEVHYYFLETDDNRDVTSIAEEEVILTLQGILH